MTIEPSESNGIAMNTTITWAATFVNELARCGLTRVCIAPGSRSTPLALAFHAHPTIKVFVHLDERSAAFFALGLALGQQKAVAVLSTSGTAGTNFLPAIIEAKMSNIPLLVLTADRPPELRHSGANQTIDQIKMFGDHVLWSVDVGLPEIDAPRRALQNLRTLAARALFTAQGIEQGPVHLNFPFRKPLEPTSIETWQKTSSKLDTGQPYTKIERGFIQPTSDQINLISNLIEDHPRGIIVCGPGYPQADFPKAVARLSQISGYPILADPLSGVRFGPHMDDTAVISGYETFLAGNSAKWPRPQLILRFGRVPTSKWLHEYLRVVGNRHHIHIRENGAWADGDHITSFFLQASPSLFCNLLADKLKSSPDKDWSNFWNGNEIRFKKFLKESLQNKFFDGSIVSQTIEHMPEKAFLFAGNSLPVRHVDQFCPPTTKKLQLFSNRGASGIDGNISTALGLAAQTEEPVVLLLGDITFYHDSNGLLAIKKYGIYNITIVLLNNNGGGIFRRLPIASFTNEYGDLFDTPHDLQFKPYAQLFGLDYVLANDMPSFTDALSSAFNTDRPLLIEVQTNSENDELTRKQVVLNINQRLKGS